MDGNGCSIGTHILSYKPHALVAQGDHVDAGQPLVEVDFDVVRAAGFDPTVFVIVCERSENSTLREHASGPVAVKEPVVWLSE